MISSQDVLKKWQDIEGDDERILFIVGGPGSGKSRVIRELAEQDSWKYIEAKDLIDEAFIEINREERPAHAKEVICNSLKAYNAKVVLIDSIDVLFVPILNIDPIALLRDISKEYPIVVGWKGTFDGEKLHLEHNNNPEYFSYKVAYKNHILNVD